MKPIHLQFGVTLDPEAAAPLVELLVLAIERGTDRCTQAMDETANRQAQVISDALRSAVADVTHPSRFVPARVRDDPLDSVKLIDGKEVARLLGVSFRTVYRLNDAGRMPKSVKIGTAVRWNLKEIREWIEAGCPRRR